MPKFIAVTSKGLGPALADELAEMSIKVLESNESSASFDSNWKTCYQVNLCSRIATSVLLPILDFPSYQPDDIYNNAIKKHDFTKYLKGPETTFTIQSTVNESKIRDQRLVAMKLKDAIVDQCNQKWGARPNVDNDKPKVVFSIRLVKNQTSVSVMTNGASLSQRGYRTERTEAPLREHLAAGLLRLAGWNGEVPLVDLMCGSGTFLIEGALIKNNVFPGVDHPSFAFQNFPSFDKSAFEEVSENAIANEKQPEDEVSLFGFDVSGKALAIAKRNAQRADVEAQIQFEKRAVALHEQPPINRPGVIVCNPPYGKRLEDVDTVKDIYRDIAYILKRQYKGWQAWILSGDKTSTQALNLKSSKGFRVYNGAIECRWLCYEIR